MQGYKVGLDFGTTNSIIALLNAGGELEVFKYGPPGRQAEYIPSFITYEDGFIEIGSAARSIATIDPDIESYGNFKMQLPLEELKYANHFQGDRTPASVTKDYLHALLASDTNGFSFNKKQGSISGLVVSVPEIWQRDIYNVGRERLQNLIEDLNVPLIQLVSEPVAAGAYYAWATSQQSDQNDGSPFKGNLLVCDMGGGTFDVSLCRIYGDKKVEVLYFDGQGAEGLDSAGVAFDRRCVQSAYKAKHGHPLEEKTLEFSRLIGEFEKIKIDLHTRTTKKLANYLDAPPDTYTNKTLYKFAEGYKLTYDDVLLAFEPISQGIEQVIRRVKDWLEKHREQLNHILLVGGFSQFLLVQRAITRSLEIHYDDVRLEQTLNFTNRAYAIAYGACLIANGLVEPTEKYIHTLGIVVDTISLHSEKQERFISIIQGDTSLEALAQPQFANIEPLVTFRQNGYLDIKLWVKPLSQGKPIIQILSNMIQLPSNSLNDRWRVGMRVDPSQIAYLIIEEIHSKKRIEYKLGNVIASMFPGFVLRE